MNLPRSFPVPRRHRTGAAAVVLCALLAACSSGGRMGVEPEPPAPPPVPELAAGVYALAGVSASLPFTDLEPFRGIVGDTRFVALGESTHMSGGYYQAKARLVRFMVQEMGFRVLAWETPWLEGLAATRYVESCTGTPEAALGGMLTVWRDESVRDLLRWLCEYNAAHPGDPVTFFGFDVQEPWRSAPALRRFVERAAPGQAARTEPLFGCLGASMQPERGQGYTQFFASREYRDFAEGRRDTAGHQRCLAGIAEMEAWIQANAPALQAATSAAAVEEARLSLVALRAWEDQLWVPDPGGYQARDAGMAQLVRRLHALHAPGKKTIIWAWNWHIARRYEEVRGFDEDAQRVVPRQGARAMGSFLHDALGADYLPVALIGYHVDMTGTNDPPVQSDPRSVERRLHDLAPDYLLVDLRQPLPGTLLPAGAVYRVSQEWGDPYRQFGALIFMEHSPPMTLVTVPAQ